MNDTYFTNINEKVIKSYVQQLNHEIEDFSCHNGVEMDYLDVALENG
ncbi:hypothetical protein J3T65_02870 [Staphylococcus simiae]|nr:hypothetical protein [Staphylococcus simiae]MBO1198408.1 hypothetical protein [Staphylococcus simiae]MBO1202873.1 hypothetical protein [Staphylococcus simiae]MBO1228939.1 hypothetical protein [Staphylococcus simiae]